MEYNKKVWDKMLEIILNQKNLAKVATEQKRQLFRDRQYLNVNINRSDDKVNVQMIRSIKNTLLALYYQDKLTVRFASRNPFFWEEAENINNLAQSDYDTMDMEVQDYANQSNRFEYWVGIRVVTGWDKENDTPTYIVVDPMDWYPDPSGWLHINNFNFMWFERKISIEQLENQKDKRHNVKDLQAKISSTQQQNEFSEANPRLLSSQPQVEAERSKVATIYYHYFIWEWKSVQAITDADCTIMLSAKVVEPLAQKSNKYKGLKFPVSLNYYEPKQGDPRGVCIYDIAEDKQKIKQLMLNLMVIRATREAMGDKMFIDHSVYQTNKTQLLKPTVGLQYIPVKSNGLPMSNFVYPNPLTPISPDVYNLPNILEQQMQSDIGLSEQTRGIDDGTAKTATEVSTDQANQNISLLLGTKINSRWEKQFWKLWYLSYEFYFPAGKKKSIDINKGIATMVGEVERKDVVLPNPPNIFIETLSEYNAKNAKMSQQYMAMLPMFLQDPTIPESSKRFMKRKALRLQWHLPAEIDVMVGLSPDEMQAKEDVSFLNRNLPVDVGDMSEDHLTYLTVYQTALDTPATKAAIMARQMAYKQSWQAQAVQQQSMQQGGAMWWMANAGASQMMASNLQTTPTMPMSPM